MIPLFCQRSPLIFSGLFRPCLPLICNFDRLQHLAIAKLT